MSTYTSFAVAAAGDIGLSIINELLARRVSVLVITRSSVPPKPLPGGPNRALASAAVDDSDQAAVVSLLRKHRVQVVISTVTSEQGIYLQTALAEAAKSAGVRLFVPSEYGMPSEGHTSGVLGKKAKFAEFLRMIGLPSARFYAGVPTNQIPWLTGLDETGRLHIVGRGEAPISFTAVPDIAGFVAHILTTLSPSQLANSVFRIQGVRANLQTIATRLGPNVRVIHVDTFPSSVSDYDLKTAMQEYLDRGYGSTGWDPVTRAESARDAGSSNYLWPGHQWMEFREVLGI